MRTLLQPLLLTCLLPIVGLAEEAKEIRILYTPSGIRFGILGNGSAGPLPTLFLFGGRIEDTLPPNGVHYITNIARHDILCVSLDIPCHGQLQKPNEPQGMAGWCHRLAREDNWIPNYVAKLSTVLDYLVDQKMTDPGHIGACGISRGGFVALHWAAADRRVRCVAGLSPVTHLPALREFQGMDDDPLTQTLSVHHLADKLVGRSLWIQVGNNDRRVSTAHCVSFIQHVVDATRKVRAVDGDHGKPVPAELHITPVPGHTADAVAHNQAAAWVREQLAK